MREKVHLNGIAGLAQHEILEFMLYPYVPQKDTVPIAHALLDDMDLPEDGVRLLGLTVSQPHAKRGVQGVLLV